ncbi:peptidase domain-containing ABC transporter [Alteromonas ponticola]|uniref:Peptidase domain-containing ABC transporter n=1 Tax=Alteromonas ponticola TaxID=2720613 RepID=A0ABX1R1R1_9ALTE|nr:peptidase domain-containing ABC transporter [Alteromonas ponticola]NMH59125.1 peptidase domain-containing ABC transporter [Alteromonas ponticola]
MTSIIDKLNFTGSNRLPVIQQSESAECGLACLAMIAGFYGHHTDLNNLRREHRLSLKGSSLKGLTSLAEKLGFSYRPIRCEPEGLKNLAVPCILHWNMNHFVVLKQVKGDRVVIHDPALGERKASLQEVSSHFTGVALELSPAKNFKAQEAPKKAKFSSFWSELSGLKKSLLTIFAYSMLLQVFILATPLYMQIVVDDVLISNDYSLLNILALGFAAILLLQAAATALRSLIIMLIGNQLSLQMNANLVTHLLKLPIDYFEKRHIGDVVSRFRSLEALKNLLTSTLVESLVDGLMVVGLVVMMYLYSVELLMIVTIASLIYLGVRSALYLKFKDVTREHIVAGATRDSNFMETVRGIQSIKLFSKEADRIGLFNNFNVTTANNAIKVERLKVVFTWSSLLIFGVENILVIYLGAGMVMDTTLTVGMLLAFIAYKTQFDTKINNLIDKFIEFKMSSLHLERLGDIVLTEQEDHLGSLDDQLQIEGHVEVKGVSMRYSDEDDLVLSDISFSIEQGESVAIVGPSGCGKSTLMKVMLGLLQPETGKVELDGRDIRKVGLLNYRSHVASVMQNDRLLSGSIYDNITFFSHDTDMEWVETCAKTAGIHDDIIKLPMGYQSLIGDMGSSLSGGQMQRLLLARALYRKPKVLFLDEATSSLDLRLEQHVNQAIKAMNITRIIIAHRPQSIMSADRIIKFAKGRCLELSKEEFAQQRRPEGRGKLAMA